jgi:hypothetical protein
MNVIDGKIRTRHFLCEYDQTFFLKKLMHDSSIDSRIWAQSGTNIKPRRNNRAQKNMFFEKKTRTEICFSQNSQIFGVHYRSNMIGPAESGATVGSNIQIDCVFVTIIYSKKCRSLRLRTHIYAWDNIFVTLCFVLT